MRLMDIGWPVRIRLQVRSKPGKPLFVSLLQVPFFSVAAFLALEFLSERAGGWHFPVAVRLGH